MKFRTKIALEPIPPGIAYGDHLVCLGSCFAEEMGHRLANIKMSVDVNLAGILYNPVSIAGVLDVALRSGELQEKHLVYHDGLWHSFLHHGVFSRADQSDVTKNIRQAHASLLEGIRKARWLILTLGTAHVFRHQERQLIVANCHKIPASEFHRARLPVDRCFKALAQGIKLVRKVNPAVHILCTVSPVRHIRDGLHENQLSKATLLLAVEEACSQFEHVQYFPSYEICMDDLRDYRFYEQDMVHPSKMAVDYIWEHFTIALMDQQTRSQASEILKIRRAMEHRIRKGNTEQIRKFAVDQLGRINALSIRFPALSFEAEIAHFKAMLDSN